MSTHLDCNRARFQNRSKPTGSKNFIFMPWKSRFKKQISRKARPRALCAPDAPTFSEITGERRNTAGRRSPSKADERFSFFVCDEPVGGLRNPRKRENGFALSTSRFYEKSLLSNPKLRRAASRFLQSSLTLTQSCRFTLQPKKRSMSSLA